MKVYKLRRDELRQIIACAIEWNELGKGKTYTFTEIMCKKHMNKFRREAELFLTEREDILKAIKETDEEVYGDNFG